MSQVLQTMEVTGNYYNTQQCNKQVAINFAFLNQDFKSALNGKNNWQTRQSKLSSRHQPTCEILLTTIL